MLQDRARVLVVLIAAVGFASVGFAGDLASQTKKSRRAKTRGSSATSAPAASPSPAPTPAEPEPVKKNERDPTSPVAQPTPQIVSDPNAPRYSYEFTQPASNTTRVLIEHDNSGHGTITFQRMNFAEPVTDPFQLSAPAWTRVKALWDGLHFLDSEQVYQTERQYPQIGTVHLKLQQGSRQRAAEFNYTNDKQAAALAAEYRKAAEQAMLVFDIGVARETDPLVAPDLMRRFETMLKSGDFSDANQLAPLLQDLSVDERIPLIARNHAARLLKQISK